MSLSNPDLERAYYISRLSAGVVAGTSQPIPGSISYGETVNAFGSLLGNNTSAGAQIVAIASGSLPSGLYLVEVTDCITAAATPTLQNNIELRVGGVSRRKIFYSATLSNSSAVPYGAVQKAYVRLDGSTNLSLNYIANFGAAETQTHDMLLQATKISD